MKMTERQAEKLYKEMLDECYGTVTIAGYEYATSLALKEIDEVAYRCGFNDFCDAEGIDLDE